MKMGAAASITEPIDKASVQTLLGDRFDEAQFDANAGEDNKIGVEKWAELAAAGASVSETDAVAAPADATPAATSETDGAEAVIETADVSDDGPWKTEYCVFGVCCSKDDAKLRELYQADGTLQVVEEKGAPARGEVEELPHGGEVEVGNFRDVVITIPCEPLLLVRV